MEKNENKLKKLDFEETKETIESNINLLKSISSLRNVSTS